MSDTRSENKNASIELVNLINEWADSFIKSRQLVIQIIEQSQRDGLSSIELRMLLEFALKKRGLSDRQIRRLLPSELKDSCKIRVADSQGADIFDANAHNNPQEESYTYDDTDWQGEYDKDTQQQIEVAESSPAEKVETEKQKTLDEYLDGYAKANPNNRFYIVNQSLNQAKYHLSSHGASITIKKLYYEI